MNNKVSIIFNTIIVLYLLILPHTIYTIIDMKYNVIYFISLLFATIILFFLDIGVITKYIFKNELIFLSILIFFSLLTSFVHEKFSPGLAIIAPVVTYLGYVFLNFKTIDLSIFKFVFIILYIYFYIIYFSLLPDLFYRPDFDEDLIVFETASSNGISTALNITLYAYIVLNYFLKQNKEKEIFILSIINLLLILIQQSRIGILVGFLLFFISFYERFYISNKTSNKFVLKLIIIISIVVTSTYISNFFNDIGLGGIESYGADIRYFTVRDFISGLNPSNFIFGYDPNKTYFGFDYTYNVFLDFWNKYSFFSVLLFISVLLYRIINYRYYFFPIYYLFPFLLYSFVESFFFPEYWDVIVFLVIFTRKDERIASHNLYST